MKPAVPAELAYKCLKSIPFNRTSSVQLLDTITPFLDWQTSLTRVKSPPRKYASKVQRPYDFHKTWGCIRCRVIWFGFPSQYDFAIAVYHAFTRVHDTHFSFTPKEVVNLFSFGRPLPLISVSITGRTPPKPYVYSDIVASVLKSTGSVQGEFKPSAIVEINGRPVKSFLERWSQVGYLQDPDALYNNLFYSPAQIALGDEGTGTGTFSGGGRGQNYYPGPTTKFKFENGTVVTVQNYARVWQDFKGIQSGADVAAKYLQYPKEALNNLFQEAAVNTKAYDIKRNMTVPGNAQQLPAPGYPKAVHRHSKNWNSGYFLGEEKYRDVVVLAVNSFAPGWGKLPREFQQVVQNTIASAKAGNKTKLIIDVSANAGGTVLVGYDLVTQLFGKALPYGGGRFRAHEALDLLGRSVSQVTTNLSRTLNLTYDDLDLVSSAWNYRTDTDASYHPFKSWAEKYHPRRLGPGNDKYTSIVRWNLSDPVLPWNGGDIYVSGYLNRSGFTGTPFKRDNIIVVYDGYCGSTCAVFHEIMKQQFGIKSIALGGRSNKNIIQAVGGTKGCSTLNSHYMFYRQFVTAYKKAPAVLQNIWQKSPFAKYTAVFSYQASTFRLNTRDSFQQGDKTNTPLQFVYEPADCRILYTPQMVVDQSVVWRTVADTVWGNSNACVAGSNRFYRKKKCWYCRAFVKDNEDNIKARTAISKDIELQPILDSFAIETRSEESMQ
ncbi:hypothetical protein K461DRAFT_233506 [Myriangium duriaei CBS 260.36]|uniref:CPAF-like PDZ domain-containing protein n=1 Tax=Myriangium duriaei CBS 260.36 TaxID=1168546 RepID=A0A9P4MCQ3_9PEZI|nr:hypothetical protein K461DRAFT_233506 [Myriangium duriaei CBS 260.36]